MKTRFKKSFALFITILLVMITLSVASFIVESKTLNMNIDSLKYHHLQCKIHLNFVENYIKKYNSTPTWDNNSENYILQIQKDETNNIYHIFISSKEDLKVRIYSKLELSD